MSLYGSFRDIQLFKNLNQELIHRIIENNLGYYKPKIDNIVTNLYGESIDKSFIGPVLLQGLIERGDYIWQTDSSGPDTTRPFKFRFIKDDLETANIVPEVGDIIMWNDDFFEVDGVNQNQFIVGKDPDYSYSNSANNFGTSLSIILEAHYTRPERWGIKQVRL